MSDEIETAKRCLLAAAMWNTSDVDATEIKYAAVNVRVAIAALIAAVRASAPPTQPAILKAVDDEEELDGPMPAQMAITARADIEGYSRAVVRATKDSIRNRLEALLAALPTQTQAEPQQEPVSFSAPQEVDGTQQLLVERAERWIAAHMQTDYGDRGLRLQMEDAGELIAAFIEAQFYSAPPLPPEPELTRAENKAFMAALYDGLDAAPPTWQPIATSRSDEHILVCDVDGEVSLGGRDDEDGSWWSVLHGMSIQPTHWMPLPAPPTQMPTSPPLAERIDVEQAREHARVLRELAGEVIEHSWQTQISGDIAALLAGAAALLALSHPSPAPTVELQTDQPNGAVDAGGDSVKSVSEQFRKARHG